MMIESGKIYVNDLDDKGKTERISDIYIGKNSRYLYKMGLIKTVDETITFKPYVIGIEIGSLFVFKSTELADLRDVTGQEKSIIIKQLKKEKYYGNIDEEIDDYYDKLETIIECKIK